MEKAATKVRAIITGATGMVGEGVMHECLIDPQVEAVLVINRKPGGIIHPKLTEIIHKDFYDITPIADQLKDYNACFFCLGVTSIGKNEEEYFKLTHTLTLNFAKILSDVNMDMVFCYVSGANTDSTEKGKTMWARVKGKTENDLMQLPFKQVYAFRPGYIQPTKGLKRAHKAYYFLGWLYPILRWAFPNAANSLQEVGQAMIHCVTRGYDKPVIEVQDIIALAKK